MKNIPQTLGYNFPVYTNYFVAGTIIVIDRTGDVDWVFIDLTLQRALLTYYSTTDISKSSYARLSGLSTINNISSAFIKIEANYTQAAIGPWTSAEAKHAGICIYNTDPDNNYILMISPAASAIGERDIQLVKQVVGVETVLDTDNYGSLSMNLEYRLTLERVAGVLTGRVYDILGNLLSTVSASDSALSSGNTGVHGFSVTFRARGIEVN